MKRMYAIITLCTIFSGILLYAAPALRSQNVSPSTSGVQFTVDSSTMYFYNSAQNKVYVYGARGEVKKVFTIEELGKKMRVSHQSE